MIPIGFGYLRIPAPNHIGYIDVLAYYSPDITSTLISENGIFESSTDTTKDFSGQTIHKFFPHTDGTGGTITVICHHKRQRSKDIVIHGALIGNQCFTHPLILPEQPLNSPYATTSNSIELALHEDPLFSLQCSRATNNAIKTIRNNRHEIIDRALPLLPAALRDIPFKLISDQHIPIYAIRTQTQKLLWHQRLGHICDDTLYSAHNYIDGVPKFKRVTSILDQCPTCIQAKMSKSARGHSNTRKATQPYEGLSIDFSFSGMKSSDTDRRSDYEGINGETSWIVVTDHFTGMKHGDTRISKAAPVSWLRHFLDQYKPRHCHSLYVHMDQGGELYNNPKIRNLFSFYGYAIHPTGADASHQNGPAERAHRTLANTIRALLLGADLDIKFWPYAFYHAMRLANSFPERGKNASSLQLATGKKQSVADFRTFGCRVWVRPTTPRKAKFIPNAKKGIFLGFVPYTTRNIFWFDPSTSRVKIATHARFDEGMNDLPSKDTPPNVLHLERIDGNARTTAEPEEVSTSTFDFSIEPFIHTTNLPIRPEPSSTDNSYGFIFEDDELLQRCYIKDVRDKSPASRLYSSRKATRNKVRGAYVLSINNNRVFTSDEAYKLLRHLHDQGVDDEIPITFAPEKKLSATTVRKHANEYGLFAPTTKWDESDEADDVPFVDRDHRSINKLTASLRTRVQKQLAPTEDDMDISMPTIDLHSLRAIAALHRTNDRKIPNRTKLKFDEDTVPDTIIEQIINAIQSKSTTQAEQALGHFTRKKLKLLTTWKEWEAGERKQLDQFEALQMYGEPILPPNDPNTIILRAHWQYHVKRCGTRRARLCCNGSKYAAPTLHALAMTYSSCVEHPIQRLFFGIAAQKGLKVYGGDAKDAYGHSPGPEIPTYMKIDNQYADWYFHKYGKQINRNKVLPVLRALQGHPESGRLWETHINKILKGTELNFKSTTHDKTIYTTEFGGETIYMLRQVDDFAIACTKLSIADQIYDIIGSKLQLPGEDKPPFAKLGLINDFNGIDISQTEEYIELSCSNYIDRIVTTHGWETEKKMQPASKPMAPLCSDALNQIQAHEGPKEGTFEHLELQRKHGFAYRTLLGEMMFAYVSCRPDIGYAITLMSKYGSNPSDYHYKCLKDVAKYLRTTKTWGIRFKRPSTLLDKEFDEMHHDRMDPQFKLPKYPEDITKDKLICFVDAAYGNDPKKRRSTTGYAFTYSGGAIVYRSKAQSITAQSSTEAEFLAAVTAAKTARFLRSVLKELGLEQCGPTPIYEDNASTIEIVNAQKPTERTRHIDIRFFAIQDWQHQTKDIILKHIPGVINPADDLTKPLGWVLHSRHARYIMGHCNYANNLD